MICPKCGTEMNIGTSHDEGGKYQWECHNCGYIEVVYKED